MVGPIIAAAGFALLAVPGIGGSYWRTFFLAMVVLGFGMAVSVAPLTTTVMRAAEDRYAGVASGINNATARVAGMLAVAILGAIAVGVFGATLDKRLAKLQVPVEVQRAARAEVPKLAAAEVPPQIRGAQREMLERVLDESFVLSFRITMLAAAGLASMSALCAALMIDPRSGVPDEKARR